MHRKEKFLNIEPALKRRVVPGFVSINHDFFGGILVEEGS